MKERLYGFTQVEIFDRCSRTRIRNLEPGTALHFQVNQLLDRLERDEADVEVLKEQVLFHAGPFMREIETLTSMKGI